MRLKPYLKKSGKFLKADWYCIDHSCFITTHEIFEEIKDGHTIEVDMEYNGKHIERYFPYEILLNLISCLELCDPKIDQELVRRIIVNGGLSSYAKKLEKQINA